MHTVVTAPRSSGAKTCAKCKPLTFVHVDENDPQVEQCKSEREEGSKISRIHYVGSDRPVKIAHKTPHSRRNARTMAASRTLDGHVWPALYVIWHASQVLGTDLVTHDGLQGPKPV